MTVGEHGFLHINSAERADRTPAVLCQRDGVAGRLGSPALSRVVSLPQNLQPLCGTLHIIVGNRFSNHN